MVLRVRPRGDRGEPVSDEMEATEYMHGAGL